MEKWSDGDHAKKSEEMEDGIKQLENEENSEQ